MFSISRLGFGKPTSVDALLDSKKVSLDAILDMEDCLGQIQLRHKKLVDYIRQPLVISQLVRYLVLGEKYAWIACEILASAIPAIMDTLVYQHKELLLVYWTLLYQNYRLKEQQIIYFTKVNQAMLARRPGAMIQFITRLSDLLPHWVYHLGDTQGCHLADLLVSLIQCEQAPEGTGIVAKWLHEHGLIRLLIGQLDTSVEPMIRETVQQVLCDIIRLSQTSHRDMISIGSNDLMGDLSSTETITQLLDTMLDMNATSVYATDSFVCGARLLINLIRYNDERHLDNATCKDGEHASNSIILGSMLACCTDRLQEFLSLLEFPRSKRKDRLGMERLVLLELMAEWVHCSNLSAIPKQGDAFKMAYCEHNAISQILDLFFAFPSCNLAHSVVCDIIGQTFENKCLQAKLSQQMILEVFTKGKLIHRILEVDVTNRESGHLAYMGHLTLLTKSIVQTLQAQPYLLTALQADTVLSIPWDQWESYAGTVIDECSKLELPLTGMPLPSPPPIYTSTGSFPLPPPPIHIPPSSASSPSPSPSPLATLSSASLQSSVFLSSSSSYFSSSELPVDAS